MAVEGSVPKPGMIVPHLVVRDAAQAVAFYVRAFQAMVLYRSPSPSGHGEHIHLRIWDSLLQVSTEEPAYRREKVEGALLASPETLAGSTCVFQIGVRMWTRRLIGPWRVARYPFYRRRTCSGVIGMDG